MFKSIRNEKGEKESVLCEQQGLTNILMQF